MSILQTYVGVVDKLFACVIEDGNKAGHALVKILHVSWILVICLCSLQRGAVNNEERKKKSYFFTASSLSTCFCRVVSKMETRSLMVPPVKTICSRRFVPRVWSNSRRAAT